MVPLVATTAVDVALYILNQKRAHLNDIQMRYRVPITVTADENMHVSQFVIERAAEGEIANGGGAVVHMDWAHHHEAPPDAVTASSPAAQPTSEGDGEPRGQRPSRRRRRRGRRPEGGEGQRPPHAHAHVYAEPHEQDDEDEREDRDEDVADSAAEDAKAAEARDENGAPARKGPRRRGRRGGRRGRPGQRPQRAPGDDAEVGVERHAQEHANPSGDSEGRQNGAGRQRSSEEAPPREVQRKHNEAEHALATAATTREKPPATSEPRVEGPSEPDVPRRKGWWQR